MQFQVPQFIEAEDKIVGPLSLKQFIYLGVAGAVSALLYFTVQAWLWLVLSLPVFALAAAFAFVKIEGRPFEKVGLAALRYYWEPQTYVWQPAAPHLPKDEAALRETARPGLSVESILGGLALHKTWQDLQTGTKTSPAFFSMRHKERYEIYRRLSGEPNAARRVDYR